MKILVTGGAGYIGSVVTHELIKQRYQVVVMDNLSRGHRSAVSPDAEFVKADLHDTRELKSLFHKYRFDAVMHMAAETVVSESVSDPQKFFRNNVIGSLNLLDEMMSNDVFKIVFSSSAAVYGEPKEIPIQENGPKFPLNAYGESKLIFEGILSRYGKAYGIKHICLRYFNAAGATEFLGEDHRTETHLIPNILKSALAATPVSIFGANYATADGTCVRDFVHVVDVARAHVLALEKLDTYSGRAFNLGNQRGYSILEVVKKTGEITQADIPIRITERRSGDPAVLVASSVRATQDLGWKPEFSDLGTIINSAWEWTRKHPNGYNS